MTDGTTRPDAGASVADERYRPRVGQYVLAAIVVGLLAVLAVTGAAQAADVRAKADGLSSSEATRTNVVLAMRESLALSVVMEKYLDSRATRRDVQVARALLNQRLSVVSADGTTGYDAMPRVYREALDDVDGLLARVPAGTLKPLEHSLWTMQAEPVLREFTRQSRRLGDLETVTWRSQNVADAESSFVKTVRESALLVAALIAAIALGIWIAVDVRRYFRRVDAAIEREREVLDDARAALARATLLERGQARVLERMATGAPLHEQLASVVELASRATGGLPFRLLVADRVVLSEAAQLRPAGDDLVRRWAIGDGTVASESGELELFGAAGAGVPDDVDTVAQQCTDLATLVLEHDRSAALLEYQANHDALTGLPNRALLLDRIGEAMRRRERSGEVVAVLFCDLDRFKEVNDTFGHEAGDDVLIEVAGRFRQAVRLHDTVARLGGDEFVVLATWMNDEGEVDALAERVRDSIVPPFRVRGRDVEIGVSIGVAIVDDFMTDPRSVLHAADVAMYRGKPRASF
jgi:diguanylate cyclase (GGDEF)-like protein